MTNPFIKNSQTPSQAPRLMDIILSNPIKSNFSSNAMGTSQDRQNINMANTIPVGQGAIFPNVASSQNVNKTNQSISPIHQAESASMSISNSKIDVRVKINQQPCRLQEVHPISSLQELKRQNITIVLPEKVAEVMLGRLQLTAKVANCFGILLEIIKGNNESILKNIKDIVNRNLNLTSVNLRTNQINRLMQGLCFYQPVHNEAIQLFQKTIKKHELGQQVCNVSKENRLDYLKAFYVVRQVHFMSGKIKGPSSSFIPIQSQNIMSQQLVLKLAKDFLEADKKNLLDCYFHLLKYNRRPSDYKICTSGDEFIILWANIAGMERESPAIQQLIFQLFNHYRLLVRQNQKEQQNYIKLMRIKMIGIKLNDGIKNKLYSIGADDDLKNEQMSEQNFKGPYLDLFHFFIAKKEINYRLALVGLRSIQALPQLWLPHFQKYISEISFIGNNQDKLLKGIYIYCVMKHLKDSHKQLSKNIRQKMIKTICRQASLLLGVIFCDFIQDKYINIWLLQIFLKETEDSLAIIERRDSQVIQEYIQSYKYGELTKMALSLIELTFLKYIEIDDLQTIEREFSFRKIFVIDLQPQRSQTILQCVRYYLAISNNLPSHQQRIQDQVHSLFKHFGYKKYETSTSLSYYNYKLLQRNLTSIIIRRHLIFLLTADVQIHDFQSYVLGWLAKIQYQSERVDFSLYIQFVCLIGEALLKTNKLNYMQIFIAALKCFHDSILLYTHSQNNYQVNYSLSSLRLFYIISKLIEYNRIYNVSTEFSLLQVRDKMRQILRKKNSDPTLLITQNSQVSIVIRLILCCNLMSETGSLLADQNDEDNLIISSWMDRKDERTNKFELYSTICKQLEKETDNSLMEAFECAAKYEKVLFEMMIRDNYIHLVGAVQKKVIFSYQQAYQILYITNKMHRVLSVNDNAAFKKKQYNFTNLVLSKILSHFLNQDIPFSIYELVLNLLTKSMNTLQYSVHMMYLSKGANLNYFKKSSSILRPSHGKYCLYILCLQLAKKKKGVDFQNIKEKTQLINEIRIFMKMGLAILEQAKKQQYYVMSDFHRMFLIKITHLLICCLQQSTIHSQIIQNATIFRDQLTYDINGECQFAKQIALMNQLIKDDTSLDKKRSSKIISIKVCLSEQQYNELLLKYINSYNSKQWDDRELQFMENVMELMQKNEMFTIKQLIIQKRFIQKMIYKEGNVIVFIKLVHKLLTKVNHKSYCMKNNIKTVTMVINLISTDLQDNNHLQQLIIYKNFLKLIHSVLNNSMISIFALLDGFKGQFIYILQSIEAQLEIETSTISEDSNYLILDTAKLETNWTIGQSRKQNFSLWSLLKFRQKLLLIEIGLSCCRCFNGISDIKSHNLVFAALKQMQFLAANMEKLNSTSNNQKIQKLKMFLDLRRGKSNQILSFVDRAFSLKQLSQICHRIGTVINCLNFELTLDQTSLLETFVN